MESGEDAVAAQVGRVARRRGVLLAALLLSVAAVVAIVQVRGSGSPRPEPEAALPTCGTPPHNTGAHAGTVQLVLHIPRSIRQGSYLEATTSLRSSASLAFSTGAPALLTVLRDGHVVAGTSGSFGVGKDYSLGAGTTTTGPTVTLGLVQCHDVGVPDTGVPALPPGRYEVIATIEDVTPGRISGRLASEPEPLTITR